MVTIKDIAQRLGIAPSTVGRALAGNPRISRDTSERVRAAADRLGYVAHSPAQVMRGATSTLLGLAIPDIQNDFYSTVAKAMSESYGAAGFQLVLALTDDDPDTELRQIRGLLSARAAGVVVVPCANPSAGWRSQSRDKAFSRMRMNLSRDSRPCEHAQAD